MTTSKRWQNDVRSFNSAETCNDHLINVAQGCCRPNRLIKQRRGNYRELALLMLVLKCKSLTGDHDLPLCRYFWITSCCQCWKFSCVFFYMPFKLNDCGFHWYISCGRNCIPAPTKSFELVCEQEWKIHTLISTLLLSSSPSALSVSQKLSVPRRCNLAVGFLVSFCC